VPTLPISIPEEILDYYAFVFCQFGFGQLNMTFEQFLLVASAVRSSGLTRNTNESPKAPLWGSRE